PGNPPGQPGPPGPRRGPPKNPPPLAGSIASHWSGVNLRCTFQRWLITKSSDPFFGASAAKAFWPIARTAAIEKASPRAIRTVTDWLRFGDISTLRQLLRHLVTEKLA